MALFENYDRRIDKINGVLKQYGIELRRGLPRNVPGQGL